MVHECPECRQTCCCNGDIDEEVVLDEESVVNCIHWKECCEDDSSPFYLVWENEY